MCVSACVCECVCARVRVYNYVCTVSVCMYSVSVGDDRVA